MQSQAERCQKNKPLNGRHLSNPVIDYHETVLTPEDADRAEWHVNWVAVGKVC